MTTAKNTYYILSGEGTQGTWSGPFVTTERGARQRAARERCGGDRWASVFVLKPECEIWEEHLLDIDTGDLREVPERA